MLQVENDLQMITKMLSTSKEGDHCEKPMEIALKSNLALISVFEESKEEGKQGTMGIEIENSEVLFADQVHICPSYSTN
jgi:hypothetical protein